MATKVLILAGDTDGNLGDLAIVTATCEWLRRVDPSVRISLPTSRPDRDSRRLGIIPLKRGFRGAAALARAARDADLVICGGGGLFQDDDSLLKMPYWAVRLACLRPLADRIAGFSIGAGPLDNPVSRLFARLALQALDPVSVRDPLAREVLQPLARQAIDVVPDPAFLLQPAAPVEAAQALREAGVPSGKPLVGVSLRRWFHMNSNLIPHKYAAKLGLRRNRGRAMMSAFTESVAGVLDELATQLDARIVFMPTYDVAHEQDSAVCRNVADAMKSGRSSLMAVNDPKLYKAIAGLLSVMLCGRMHPAILAAAQGTPVVGLAYNQKFFGTFSLLGQSERCLSIADFVQKGETGRLFAMLREAIVQPAQFRPDASALAGSTASFLEKLIAPVSAAPVAVAAPRTQTG